MGFNPFSAAGGGDPIENLDVVPYFCGFGTDGGGTLLTSGGSINTQGSEASFGDAFPADASGVVLYFGGGGSTAIRYQITILDGAGGSVLVPDLHFMPGLGSSGVDKVYLPLNISSGVTPRGIIRASTANSTLRVAMKGVPASAQTRPCFDIMEALNIDTTNTYASTTNVPVDQTFVTGAGSFAELVDPTANTYGALLATAGASPTTALTQAQHITARIGVGADGAETEIDRWFVYGQSGGPQVLPAMSLIEKSVASGSRIGAAFTGPLAETGFVRVGLYGFR